MWLLIQAMPKGWSVRPLWHGRLNVSRLAIWLSLAGMSLAADRGDSCSGSAPTWLLPARASQAQHSLPQQIEQAASRQLPDEPAGGEKGRTSCRASSAWRRSRSAAPQAQILRLHIVAAATHAAEVSAMMVAGRSSATCPRLCKAHAVAGPSCRVGLAWPLTLRVAAACDLRGAHLCNAGWMGEASSERAMSSWPPSSHAAAARALPGARLTASAAAALVLARQCRGSSAQEHPATRTPLTSWLGKKSWPVRRGQPSLFFTGLMLRAAPPLSVPR